MGRNKEVTVEGVFSDYSKLGIYEQLELLQRIEEDIRAKKEEHEKKYNALERATNGKHN